MPLKNALAGLLSGLMLLSHFTAKAEETYTFGIVPQQSAVKTVRTWGPLIQYLSEHTGKDIKIKTAKDIPTFEQQLRSGVYDFAYMNPYHYVVFHDAPGYQAVAKARNKKIHGILVARKGGGIEDIRQLNGLEVAYPAPAAFAATLVTRSELKARGILVKPAYVSSHDSVYLNVAAGRYPAGGGVLRTLKNMPQKVRDQLVILHTTKGYTPHAIAAHPRVPADLAQAVQQALVAVDHGLEGQQIVSALKVKGFEAANDRDWDDVRALKLDEL